MDVPDTKRLKGLETENARLKRLVAERDLEIGVMKEISGASSLEVLMDYDLKRHARSGSMMGIVARSQFGLATDSAGSGWAVPRRSPRNGTGESRREWTPGK